MGKRRQVGGRDTERSREAQGSAGRREQGLQRHGRLEAGTDSQARGIDWTEHVHDEVADCEHGTERGNGAPRVVFQSDRK
jgi:hypothetical protein